MRHTARRRARLWTGIIAIILLGLATAAEEDCETTPQDDPADRIIATPERTAPARIPIPTPTLIPRATPTIETIAEPTLTIEPTIEPTSTPTVEEALKALIFCEKLVLKEEIYWGISPSTLANLDPRFSGTLEPGDYIRVLTPKSSDGAIRVKVYPHDLRTVNSQSNDQVWIDWDILFVSPEHRLDQLVFACED